MRDDPGDTSKQPTATGAATVTPADLRAADWRPTDWLAFVVIAMVAAAVRLFCIEQWSFGVLEAETFRAVTQPLSSGADGFMASDASRYPSVFLLVRWLLDSGALPGYTEGWMRLPFAFAGCLLPPLMALFSKPAFGRVVAYLLGLVLAVHPAHIGASQSMAPAVFAVTLAVMAGLAQRHRQPVLAWLLVIFAGSCHPIGWLSGVGMICAGTRHAVFARTPRIVWWILAAHVVVLVPALIEQIGVSVMLLALLAVLMKPTEAGESITRGLSLGALMPLVGGGAWWWFEPEVAEVAVFGALPALTLLACWSVVRFFHRMRRITMDGVEQPRWLTRFVAASPAIMLLGELLTATFLYFFIYAGGRPPWRDVQNAALATLRPGHEIHIVAARACNVMRTYLRPSHWREQVAGQDPHPGIRVDLLPADLDLARELLAPPDVMLVLQHDEWTALQQAPGGAELVAEFERHAIFASPQPDGDDAIYVLKRRSTD